MNGARRTRSARPIRTARRPNAADARRTREATGRALAIGLPLGLLILGALLTWGATGATSADDAAFLNEWGRAFVGLGLLLGLLVAMNAGVDQ